MLPPGVYPASVTPMTPDGKMDLPAISRLLGYFKAAGCKGAVLAGTNGEGPSLSAVEKRDLVRLAVPIISDFKIVAGIATPSLDEAVWLANQAHKAGAAAGLVMAPGYFREASEEGIARWFEALFDATDLPILVYNFPQRTGIELRAELMARLAKHPRMIGLKDSSGNEANIDGYARALAGTARSLFVGNESLLWRCLEAGWSGTISGAANCIPSWLAAVTDDYFADKKESSQAKFKLASPGIDALRGVPQPATNKAVLNSTGVLPHPDVRLPLENLAPESVAVTIEKLKSLLD
jgi:4-hydroxy-tetrahydrodipicolinate synthase